jgi:hypothetical protein
LCRYCKVSLRKCVGVRIGETLMTKRHDYDDIPGTFVFDAERSRQGYAINMFCMSLMKEENRKAFKANEGGISQEVQCLTRTDRCHPQA